MSVPCEFQRCLLASVVLVDRRGWLLLQERDEHAPLAPNQWGLVGGHVEPGESWDQALQRELEEETGLRLEDGLELWFDEELQHSPKASPDLTDRWRIWAARVDLGDADISVGEGKEIVFVDPARIISGELDLTLAASHALSRFLGSDVYRSMT